MEERAGAVSDAIPGVLGEHEACSGQCPARSAVGALCIHEFRSIGTACRGSRAGAGGVGKWPSACPRAQLPTCLVEQHQWKKLNS